jgi:hypothetical protein
MYRYVVFFGYVGLTTLLQRQNADFHIHVSVSEVYIPTMGLPFLLEEICGPILGINKSLTDT